MPGGAREPSHSSNAVSAYQYGPQVTDAIAEWVAKGYAFGPVTAAEVLAGAKVSSIMVRPKPNGSVRVILNLSAPKGHSVNDGISKDEFRAKMSSTAAWLEVLDEDGLGCCLQAHLHQGGGYRPPMVPVGGQILQGAVPHFRRGV